MRRSAVLRALSSPTLTELRRRIKSRFCGTVDGDGDGDDETPKATALAENECDAISVGKPRTRLGPVAESTLVTISVTNTTPIFRGLGRRTGGSDGRKGTTGRAENRRLAAATVAHKPRRA